MTSTRTIISLPADQLQGLDAVCRRERVSRAEAIRRAVAAYLGPAQAADARRAFGLWRGRRGEGLAYQDRLRREWDGRPGRGRRR